MRDALHCEMRFNPLCYQLPPATRHMKCITFVTSMTEAEGNDQVRTSPCLTSWPGKKELRQIQRDRENREKVDRSNIESKNSQETKASRQEKKRRDEKRSEEKRRDRKATTRTVPYLTLPPGGDDEQRYGTAER